MVVSVPAGPAKPDHVQEFVISLLPLQPFAGLSRDAIPAERDKDMAYSTFRCTNEPQLQEQDKNVHRQCTGRGLAAWPARDTGGRASELSTGPWMTFGIRMWSMAGGLATNPRRVWLRAGSPLAAERAEAASGASGRVDSG
jgi:hypothetical protein